jgi:hypothetical protein
VSNTRLRDGAATQGPVPGKRKETIVCHAPGGYLLAVAFGDESPEVRHGADEPPVPQFGDSVADSPPGAPVRSVMSFSNGSYAPGASFAAGDGLLDDVGVLLVGPPVVAVQPDA